MLTKNFSRIARRVTSVTLCSCLLSLGGCGGKNGDQVVTMTPALTEWACELGQHRQLAGVGSGITYPHIIRELPSVGTNTNPDSDVLETLRPKMILTEKLTPNLAGFVKDRDTALIQIPLRSIEEIQHAIPLLGQHLSCPKKALSALDQFDGQVQQLQEKTENLPRYKVLLLVRRSQPNLDNAYVAGGNHLISQLAALAGGDNIYAHIPEQELKLDPTDVVAKNPQVIIEFHCGISLTHGQRKEYLNHWSTVDYFDAVKRTSIYFISAPHGLTPGPRITDIAWEMAELIHPNEYFDHE